MIIIVKPDAKEERIHDLVKWIEAQGLRTHLSKGDYTTIIGVIGDISKLDDELLSGLVLEIGSAIGYSSIMMASINSDIRITTIERDKDRYDLAVFNIKKYNLDKQINIIYGDAVDTDITGMYDLIFIDAAKGKNIFFFEKYKNNLVKGGTIITDNLSFHGLVEDSDLVKTKNQRGIVNKIKNFISFLDNNEEFATEYIPVGDKIAISKRRSDYE